jgi:RNA polymerase sigma-32 factor
MLSSEEELRLARRARAGDQAAFDRLVLSHLPLVHAMARQYRAHGVLLDDLVGEAMLGLVQATRRFDPERGTRLAGYAAMWIRAYLRRFTLENRRIVRGPNTRNARRLIGGMRSVERDLERRNGTKADAEAVADALQVSPAEVEEIRTLLGARDVAVEPAAEKHRELPSQGPTPETLAADAQRRALASAVVGGALSRLEPRTRDVLVRRCLGEDSVTLADLGRDLQLSRERVRQIEVSACSQLKAVVALALHRRRIAAADLWAA